MKSEETQSPKGADSLLAGFLNHVKTQPDHTAIRYETEGVTYLQAAEQAAKLADLLRQRGLRPGERVAVSVFPSPQMVTAVLGVLWAGGVYVPIAPLQPVERRKKIYEKAGIHYCVTFEGSSALQVDSCINVKVEEASSMPDSAAEPYLASGEESAYIIFTSGSTGTPKGVEISHAAARNTIDEIIRRFGLNGEDCAIGISALDFDLSVFDIFGMLTAGGCLAVVDEAKRKEPAEWIRILEECHVTVWNTVPALFEMLLLNLEEEKRLDQLKVVLLSGDWVFPYLYTSFRQHNQKGQFVALGGATEASIWSNAYVVDHIDESWKSVPYGTALKNQKYRIAAEGKEAEPGELGELWIGGKGLSKGYVSEPELTAKAFVMDQGERWYKTGDYGYYLPDHTIVFAGRKDTQVKINGFRIELGEIETVLNQLKGVKKSVVLAQKENNQASLAAAVVLEDNYSATEPAETVSDHQEIHNIVEAKTPEDGAVYRLIQKVLHENKDIENHYLNETSQLPKGSQKIIALWQGFEQDYQETEPSAQTQQLEQALDTKTGLLREILDGKIPAVSLLEDNVLAPSVLMMNPASEKILAELSQEIALSVQKRRAEGKKTTMAIESGKQGLVLEKILSGLSGLEQDLNIVFFDSSELMLREARERLSQYPFSIEYVKTEYHFVPAKYAAKMDILVAFNSIHQFANVEEGLLWSKLLLKKCGKFYLAESSAFSSLGLISAAVIEQGFTSYQDERKFTSTPVFSFQSWKEKLERTGYQPDFAEDRREDHVALFTASPREDGIFMDEETLAAHCASNLVAYMQPKQFCLSYSFPLSANGKIDRKAISQWFVSEEKTDGKPLSGETEERLAEIWKNLLKKDKCFGNDSFFEIGGDSLLAARMISSIRNNFGVDISMKEVFDAQRLDAVAQIIDTYSADSDLEEGEL